MAEENLTLEHEYTQIQEQLIDIDREIEIIELDLSSLTGEVEASTNVIEQQQKTLRMINQRMEDLERRRESADKRLNQITLDGEKLKFQSKQKLDELATNGYEDNSNHFPHGCPPIYVSTCLDVEPGVPSSLLSH